MPNQPKKCCLACIKPTGEIHCIDCPCHQVDQKRNCSQCQFEEGHSLKCPLYEEAKWQEEAFGYLRDEPIETIFDPFSGSGTTLVAAKQLSYKYLGTEISPKYCEIANQRLRQDILL